MQQLMRHYYSLFGLSCSSELEFVNLVNIPMAEVPDVEIKLGQVPASPEATRIGVSAYATTSAFWLEIKNIANFYVSRDQIIIDKYPQANNQEIKAFLISTVFAYLLYQRQYLLLSGCALSIDNRVCLICSNSSNGKSALATSLVAYHGYSLLSDGLLVLTQDPQTKSMSPINNQLPLTLWQDSCEKLALPYANLQPVRSSILKYELPNCCGETKELLHPAQASAPFTINHIIRLETHTSPEPMFEPVLAKQKMDSLLELAFYPQLFEENKTQTKANFKQHIALANCITMSKITRPHKYSYRDFAALVHEKINLALHGEVALTINNTSQQF